MFIYSLTTYIQIILLNKFDLKNPGIAFNFDQETFAETRNDYKIGDSGFRKINVFLQPWI